MVWQGALRQRIYDYMVKYKTATSERLLNIIYADDRDGGPENANSSLHVTICKMNKILRAYGYQIRGKRGRGAFYRFVEIDKIAEKD